MPFGFLTNSTQLDRPRNKFFPYKLANVVNQSVTLIGGQNVIHGMRVAGTGVATPDRQEHLNLGPLVFPNQFDNNNIS